MTVLVAALAGGLVGCGSGHRGYPAPVGDAGGAIPDAGAAEVPSTPPRVDAATGTDAASGAGDGGTALDVAPADLAPDLASDRASGAGDDALLQADASLGSDGPSSSDAAADGGPTPADAGAPDAPVGTPGNVKVFDQIPQFGMYATTDPANYTPPAGVLMWNRGSFFVTRLTEAQQARVGADVAARITYHAQCDNYDRLASVFFLTMPKGQTPTPTDPRVELVRFITPFSNYTRGALATRIYPDVDISTYAHALADGTRDVWVGIGGGSNPYDGDPCTNANVTPQFRAIGYKFSLELVSKKALEPAAGGAASVTLPGIYYVAATKAPVSATFDNPGGVLVGRVTVVVSGHGSAAGGVEYRHTQDAVLVNGKQVGTFATQVDCASYASLSPDGNQGIFRNNTTTANPRNWCPGAVVQPRTFPAMFVAGRNTVELAISPADIPSGSYYSTSITFTAP